MASGTLDDLSASLPNGFHDAQLSALSIDYVKAELRLSLDIWVGDMNAPPGDAREAYRHADVLLSGLIYCVCEAPDAQYPYADARSVRIDIGAMDQLKAPPTMNLPPIPEGAFANWIYVDDWNAFIYVAAQAAHLEWFSEIAVISKTVVGLRLFADDLEPAEVSVLLGAEPTKCGRKGDVRTLSSGREVVARWGSWILDVDDRSPGDLNGQLAELFSALTSDLSVWRELAQRYRCDVYCGLFMAKLDEGMELTPKTLSLLADRGLSFGLEIYGPMQKTDRTANAQ